MMGRFALQMRKHVLRCVLLSSILASCALIPAARAQIGSVRYSSIVMDASTGNVLEDVNADAPRHPASLAKLMTLYMTFEALRDRRISLQQQVPVSAHAASMEPSKLGLVPGTSLTVEQAILGLVTKSANDAASALGELLGGSEDRFAQMMTLRARALGMVHTTFMNASGLPEPDQWTTARDLALLARRLITDFPRDYGYFSTPSFVWHRQVIPNHDSMLRSYPGADGMKTGYTDASGHNLITSAMRDGVRLIGVEMGAATNSERDIHMTALLDHGFEQMDVPIYPRRPLLLSARLSLVSTAHAAEPLHNMRIRGIKWSLRTGFAAEHLAPALFRRREEALPTRVHFVHPHARLMWRREVIGVPAATTREACAAHHRGKCVAVKPRRVASR